MVDEPSRGLEQLGLKDERDVVAACSCTGCLACAACAGLLWPHHPDITGTGSRSRH